MRYTEIDRRIEAVARRQHHAFTRQQALDCGASEQFIKRRLAERVWGRPMPGVYVLASSPGTWLRQLKIVELSVPGSAIAGLAAAALHRFTGFRFGRPELILPPTANTRHPLAVCHRYVGAATTTVDRIAVTTIPQSFHDIASRVPLRTLERALDDCLVGGRVSVDELAERVDFYAGSRRAGHGVIAALVAERSADAWEPPASELEALLHGVLGRLSPQPRIVRQAQFPWRSARPGRVDVLLPDQRLIVEADGRRWHTRVADFDRDRWRDNHATANGHRVQRFTWLHLHDFPNDAFALLDQAIRVAA